MHLDRARIVLGAGVAATALAATGATPVGATGGGGPVAVPVLGSGSDTTQFMMAALDNLYLFSPGCAQIPTPAGPAAWLDFSCQSPDPAGTITSENYQHDQVHEAYFLGSSNGIKQVCNAGTAGVAAIDFARSSRAPKTGLPSGNDCTGLNFVAYARDGISWEAFALTGSGVSGMNNTSGVCNGTGASKTLRYCLTQAQLQGIYVNCTITNWNQVGGKNVPISIYTPQSGSGTRSQFDTFLGGSSASCIPAAQLATHQIPENSNTGIPTSDRLGAIFPFSFGVWSTQVGTTNTAKAKLGSVDAVVPSQTSIAITSGAGAFPYGRYLFNVYCANPGAAGACPTAATTAAKNYIGEEGWICKPSASHANSPVTGNNYSTDIQNAIKSFGFVPIPNGLIGGGDPNSDFCRLFTT